MTQTATVKVSSRHQIALPSAARQRLDIKAGDRLLVDIQDDMLVLVPQPRSYTERMAGLHREIWEGVDVTGYIEQEREAWQPATTITS